MLLNLDLKILFKRLTGRRICETCNQVFNIYTSPPGMLTETTAATKPHRLIQRDDDKEEVIGKRLDVYEAQTKPLISYYQAAGLLRIVDADADMNTVFKNIQKACTPVAPAGVCRFPADASRAALRCRACPWRAP